MVKLGWFMKKILIDKRKLKNNHDYDDLVKEMNSYNDPNYKPKDENKEVWEYRRRYFKDSSSIQIGDIGIIVQPNNEITPNRTNKCGENYTITFQDYTIHFFYKGVSIGIFSGYSKSLSFDHLLENSDIIEENMHLILDSIPFDCFTINYGSVYADWDNRPFIVDEMLAKVSK